MASELNIEALARALADLEDGEEWPSNTDLGGHPILGIRDDEYRQALREQAIELLDGPIAAMIAEAERRGAVKALRELQSDCWARGESGSPSALENYVTVARVVSHRADQIERGE